MAFAVLRLTQKSLKAREKQRFYQLSDYIHNQNFSQVKVAGKVVLLWLQYNLKLGKSKLTFFIVQEMKFHKQ